MHKFLIILILSLTLLKIQGQTTYRYTWTGSAGNNSFHTPENWSREEWLPYSGIWLPPVNPSPDAPNGFTHQVIISPGAGNVIISSNVNLSSVWLKGGTLTIFSGVSVTASAVVSGQNPSYAGDVMYPEAGGSLVLQSNSKLILWGCLSVVGTATLDIRNCPVFSCGENSTIEFCDSKNSNGTIMACVRGLNSPSKAAWHLRNTKHKANYSGYNQGNCVHFEDDNIYINGNLEAPNNFTDVPSYYPNIGNTPHFFFTKFGGYVYVNGNISLKGGISCYKTIQTPGNIEFTYFLSGFKGNMDAGGYWPNFECGLNSAGVYAVTLTGGTTQTLTNVKCVDLSINKNAGTATYSGNMTVLRNLTITSGNLYINGYLTLNNSFVKGANSYIYGGTSANLSIYEIYDNNYPTSPCYTAFTNQHLTIPEIINGVSQLYIKRNNTYTYYGWQCSSSSYKGWNVYLGADLTIYSSWYIQSGQFFFNNRHLTVKGNITAISGCQITGNPSAASGTSDLTIDNNSPSQPNVTIPRIINGLRKFTLNRAYGATLGDNLDVHNLVTFIQGVLTTNSYRLTVTNTNPASIIGHDTVAPFNEPRFINGNLRRYVSNCTDYDFPVGNGTTTTHYHYLKIFNSSLTFTGSAYVDASFVPLVNTTGTLSVVESNGIPYSNVLNYGVWKITPGNSYTGQYSILCSTNGFSLSAPYDNNKFGILSRPDTSTSLSDWNLAGGVLPVENAPGRLVNDGFAIRNNCTTFSQKGIGVMSYTLPVTLSDFSVSYHDNKVNLLWSTLSEFNASHFIIERTTDNLITSVVDMINAAGFSSSYRTYMTTDENPPKGIVYYRLVQYDFDGRSETFPWKSVLISDTVIKVWYNNGNLYTTGLNYEDNCRIELYSSEGRKIFEKSFIPSDVSGISVPRDLPAGIYLCCFYVNSEVISLRFEHFNTF